MPCRRLTWLWARDLVRAAAMVPVRDRSARGATHDGGLVFRRTGGIGSCCLARLGNGLGLALRAWPVILAGLVSRCRGRAIGPGRNDMFDPVAARAGGKERCQQQSRHGGRQRGSLDHERRPLERNRRTRPPVPSGGTANGSRFREAFVCPIHIPTTKSGSPGDRAKLTLRRRHNRDRPPPVPCA